jgi:hypothetical protein
MSKTKSKASTKPSSKTTKSKAKPAVKSAKSAAVPKKRESKRRELQSEQSKGGPLRKGATENVPTAQQPLGAQKKSARKRSGNGGLGNQTGAPTQEQDPKRRLGQFKSAGEASRKGGRSKGIVGHHKRNDGKRAKSSSPNQ